MQLIGFYDIAMHHRIFFEERCEYGASVCVFVCIHVHEYICYTYVYACWCMYYSCMHVCIYIRIYIYMHIYTYI